MEKYSRVKALVSLDAIAHNFEEMHKNIKEGTKIIAVIKADGYGHGAVAYCQSDSGLMIISGDLRQLRGGGIGTSTCRDHQANSDPWPCI